MASSRWKRFAFFERHTLNIPSEVLDDLVPVGLESYTSRRSVRYLDRVGQETGNDSVSLVVTTAALPLTSKPTSSSDDKGGDGDALGAMWFSLAACSPPAYTAPKDEEPTIQLPSQAQMQRHHDAEYEVSTTTADGLVLAFVTSDDTELVHCFDVTIRCNPPSTTEKEIEDLDGFRGYFAPFRTVPQERRSSQDVINEHMEASSTTDKVLGIAACRGTEGHKPVYLACITKSKLCIWEDPHLHLSCRRPLISPEPTSEASIFNLQTPCSSTDGEYRVVDIVPGLVAVGTNNGAVLVYIYSSARQGLRLYLKIPPPPAKDLQVVSVKLSLGLDKASVFVAYHRDSNDATQMSTAGICCYDMPVPDSSFVSLSAPSARHDLDGRYVGSSTLVDAFSTRSGLQVTVARPDGLYSYSQTERIGVAPIDGTKLAICLIPPPTPAEKAREVDLEEVGSGYSLVASTDSKSGRDAVDIYDATNKLVAFHLLLSPGHKAVRAAGVTTSPTTASDGSAKSGRSSAVVLTSGGQLVTLTEKLTAEKIDLLVQKNLYSAAIVVAYADPSFEASDITTLYRRYAEHLYRKGDFSGAIDQYMNTIGSLESSHVIFRFLDAPKIPLLVKYLERLRSRDLASPVHNELLRTCYLKLNDTEAAAAIVSTSSSINKSSLTSILSNLANNPKEALATICSLDANQVADILVIHGASLARVLPRETAGVVISLCVGTYSPRALADAALVESNDLNKMIQHATDEQAKACDPYPVYLFASAFIEHPKMLRLILAHCNRNKCPMTSSLRRTLLELTLAEWNQAKRTGDTEAEKLRHKEAIAALTDSHCREIGDYDALVIVQLAGFEEGELLLYERLKMTPMLLERYAKDGSEKSRRQMLAMCQSDPEILADVLGHFVAIASEKLNEQHDGEAGDDYSEDDEAEEILEDIQEALALARRQGVLPPVRIARILAGEGTGQFSVEISTKEGPQRRTVPLSVALDYVGTILEESRKEISRLKAEVEEYNQLCNGMENEIDSLLRASHALPALSGEASGKASSRMNIDELYSKVRAEDGDMDRSTPSDQPKEAFWREMKQSEDSFDTIARFFAKGVIN